MGTDKQTDRHTGTFVGFYQIINFTKSNKDLTHLHNNKIMYYTHPKVIPWGQTNKQTNKRTNIYSIFRDKFSLPEGTSDFDKQLIQRKKANTKSVIIWISLLVRAIKGCS
jgi:hypothetical protein